jgi:hypothetical protein
VMTDARPTDDSITALRGDPHAVHVPAWMWVQQAGPDGSVSFVGSSRIAGSGESHPLRFGSDRTHQFVPGEFFWRPHWALGTDALRGRGLGGLATAFHGHPDDLAAYLDQGELLLDPHRLFPHPRR